MNMKKIISEKLGLAAMATVLLATLTACDGGKWKIEGTVEGASDALLVLQAEDNGHWYVIDSTRTKADGAFALTGSRSTHPDVYRLGMGDRYIYFPIDSVESLHLTTDSASYGVKYALSGTDEAARFVRADSVLRTAVATDGLDSASRRALAEIILERPSGVTAYFTVNRTLGGMPVFDPSIKSERRVIGAVANAFSNDRPDDPRTEYLRQIYLGNLKAAMPLNDSIEVKERGYFDIKLKDENGTERSLSELVEARRPVLLCFTRYDGEFSPALNVELKKVYDNYRSRGLEIYQVAVDADEYSWRQAARNLPWVTVHNTMADGVKSLISYNVGDVPALFLINGNGEVVCRLTSPVDMTGTLARYL